MTFQPGTSVVEQFSSRYSVQLRWFITPAVAISWILALAMFGGADLLRWLAGAVAQDVPILLAGAALCVLPGFALLNITWREHALSGGERLALASGISLALPPLLLQAFHLLGLPWNNITTLVYVAVAALVVLWSSMRHLRLRHMHAIPVCKLSWHDLMLLGLLGVALLLRLFVIRDLPVGMWGDSYHHTMISQLLVDNNGLFSSWEPYAPLTTFTYHYGFHANVAFFHWLTGMPVTKSVLLVGQLINVISIAGAYPLTIRLSGSRTAGLWAVALTAFINLLPAYFVNWGRYTQLTGQALLPALVLLWLIVLVRPRLSVRPALLTILLTASLMLTHYIVTIFLALFLLVVLIVQFLRARHWRRCLVILGRAVGIGCCVLLLASPWLLNTLQGYLARNTAHFLGKPSDNSYAAALSAFIPITPLYLSAVVVGLTLVGAVVLLIRRRWWLGLCVVWAAGVLAATNPQLVGLPGQGVINVPTAYMAMYVIVIPVAAYGLDTLVDALARFRTWLGRIGVVAGLIGLSVWGVNRQQHLIEPAHMLFTPADAVAMDWIKANTSPHDAFLVDMFPAYNDSLFVGSDGGWWIPLLTGRQTTLPPITYGSERADHANYSREINNFAWAIRAHPLPSDEGIRLLREAGINYVYSGAHQDPQRTIDVIALRQHPAFTVVYEHDGVVIFALQP